MKYKFVFIIVILSTLAWLLITIDPLFNIWSFSWRLDKELANVYGTIIGGIIGPLLSFGSFILVYSSFKETKKSNEEQVLFNRKQSFKNRINDEIKYWRNYVSGIEYIDSGSKEKNIICGEEFFVKAKVQLDKLYAKIKSYNYFDNEEDIIGITFEIFFFGVSRNTNEVLITYLNNRINNIEEITKVINDLRKIKTNYNKKIVYYGGHQGKLSHYFRQLYYIVELIDECNIFDNEVEKKELIKGVRVKMSYYEQAILCYNAFTLLGKNWREKEFIKKYEIIRNMPKNFLKFDPKKYFDFQYEYEKI